MIQTAARNFCAWRTAEEINSAMVQVYKHMMLAVLTSMIVSLLVSSSTVVMTFLFTGIMKWIVIFAPLVMALAAGWILSRTRERGLAILVLHVFAGLMGLSTASIFVVYNLGSIVSAFSGAAILFGVMSFYGYFTRRNLENIGSYLFVGLLAIILASVVNFFLGNSFFSMIISVIAIILFLAMTAYDTQRIRDDIYHSDNVDVCAITGALSLYLNFINIFVNLLNLTGSRE